MIIESIGIGIVVVLLVAWVSLEGAHRRRQGNALETHSGNWELKEQEPQHYRLVGEQTFFNPTSKLEVMIPEVSVDITLLSKGSLDGIKHQVKVTPKHPDAEPREDGYWFAYIVKSRHQTAATITLDITGPDLSLLKAVWVRINYISYGPKGRLQKTHHEIIPLRFPDSPETLPWRSVAGGQVLPIPTHLLTQLDTCPEIVRRYVTPPCPSGGYCDHRRNPCGDYAGTYHSSEYDQTWLGGHKTGLLLLAHL